MFLLAGYELDPGLLRQRPGTLAILGWLISAVLGELFPILIIAVFLTGPPGPARRRTIPASRPVRTARR